MDKILCQTEDILKTEDNPETAYRVIRERAERPPAILLDGLTVRLDDRCVLDKLTLRVNRGDRVLITGRNGAGKTTLLRTLLGFTQVETGSVELFGNPVGSRKWLNSRRRLGYVNQESVKADLPISAFEVAEIGACELPLSKKQRRKTVRNAMKQTGCFPVRKQSYTTLSGGEKQKVSLARCLSQNPDLLLLDEPTSSLDPKSKEEILIILEELNRSGGITLLMVSHDLAQILREGWILKSLSQGQIQ